MGRFFAVATLALAWPALGQNATVTWTLVTPAGPPGRERLFMVYDDDTQSIYAGMGFVDAGAGSSFLVDTNVLSHQASGDSWFTGIAPFSQPISSPAATSTPSAHVFMVNGGTWAPVGSTQALGGDWSLAPDAGWSNFANGPSPLGLLGAAAAYDSARNVVVLFGGFDTQTPTAKTYEWNGTLWNIVNPATAAPSPRFDHAMTYDRARGLTLLYGGSSTWAEPPDFAGSPCLNDLWAWNGADWALLSDAGVDERCGASLAYDSADDVTVLYGGMPASTDMLLWDGSAWQPVTPTPWGAAVPQRAYGGMVWDGSLDAGFVFGGVSAMGGVTQMLSIKPVTLGGKYYDGNTYAFTLTIPRGDGGGSTGTDGGTTPSDGGALSPDAALPDGGRPSPPTSAANLGCGCASPGASAVLLAALLTAAAVPRGRPRLDHLRAGMKTW